MNQKHPQKVKSRITSKQYILHGWDNTNEMVLLTSLETALQLRVRPERFIEIYLNDDGTTAVLPPRRGTPARVVDPFKEAEPLESGFGRLEHTLPSLEDIRLSERAMARLTSAFSQVKNAEALYSKWRLPELKQRRVLNFYGPPGTGKTMAAKALAKYCGMPAYCASVEQLMSRYMGSTQKNICRVFEEASAASAILIIDEADSLLYGRVDAVDSAGVAYNQVTSAILTMLDSSNTPIVFTTNRLQAYDQAFSRRIAHSIKFDAPDASARRGLLHSLVGELGLDIGVLTVASAALTCADIRQAVANACAAVSVGEDPSTWVLTGAAVSAEFSRMLDAREEHISL